MTDLLLDGVILVLSIYLILLMFPIPQRLNRSDVLFLLRRGRKRYGKYFIFVVTTTRRDQHQRSIQISTKLDKRATIRNMLKRNFLSYIKSQELGFAGGQKIKVLIMINKHAVPLFRELIATSDKNTILQEWRRLSIEDFTVFKNNLGNLLSHRGSTISNKQ